MKVQYKSGGDTRDGNRMMLKNQALEFKHHAQELSNAVKKAKHVDAWVVAKAERATTDLSDITHYLDGQSDKYAKGGLMPGGYVLSQLSDTEAIDLANATLKDEVGYAEDMMFNSGYAARRFLREYHSGKAEVDEDAVVDRFSQTDDLSDEARVIVEKYRDINHDEDSISEMRDELMAVGYVFDYDDDMIPYSLRPIGEEDDDDGMFADGGKSKDSYADSLSLQNILNVGDILTNAVGKRLKVYAITPSEYVLLPFGGFPSPWRKDRIHELVKTGEWVLDKFKEEGGIMARGGIMSNSKEISKEPTLKQMKSELSRLEKERMDYLSSRNRLTETASMRTDKYQARIEKLMKEIREKEDVLSDRYTFDEIKSSTPGKDRIDKAAYIIRRFLIGRKNKGLITKLTKFKDSLTSPSLKEAYRRLQYPTWQKKYMFKLIISTSGDTIRVKESYADGGMMAKGGQIDADEVEKAAKYYADNPNWTVEKLKREVSEYEDLLENWEAGNIKPSKIIGGGYKSSAVARKLADNWIRRQLAIFTKALELKEQATQKRITQTEENYPKIGDDVRGFNHKYGTRVKDVDTEGRIFKIQQSDYWDSGDIWVSFDDVTQDTDDRRTWRREVMPTIDIKRKPGEIMIGNQIVKLKFIKRCCPSIKSDGSVGNYEYSFVDEQGEPYTGYGNTKGEALKSIEDYLNKAPEVNVSDNKNTIQPEEASIGDSALVVSENKLGTISNIDFGMYYLKFIDGSTMWYNASDLRFFKDEDDYPDEETAITVNSEQEAADARELLELFSEQEINDLIGGLEVLVELGDKNSEDELAKWRRIIALSASGGMMDDDGLERLTAVIEDKTPGDYGNVWYLSSEKGEVFDIDQYDGLKPYSAQVSGGETVVSFQKGRTMYIFSNLVAEVKEDRDSFEKYGGIIYVRIPLTNKIASQILSIITRREMSDGGMMAKGGWIKSDEEEDFYYYSTPDKKIKTPFWYSVHEVKDIGTKETLHWIVERGGTNNLGYVRNYARKNFESKDKAFEYVRSWAKEIANKYKSSPKKMASGGMMKKGGITGGYEDLTDMYMSQKIEMLLSKIRPYENYYIDEESNKLYIYFTPEITTEEAEYVMDLLTSSPEFFKGDTATTDYDSQRDRAVVSVELNRKVEYGKGGATFQDKVNAISGRLEGTEVPRRLRSDYGRRYNKEEAKKAAQRIAGAMRKKGY